MVEKYGHRGQTWNIIFIMLFISLILYFTTNSPSNNTLSKDLLFAEEEWVFFYYFLVFATVVIMWGLLLGGSPLVWCSSVHHAALSRRRPGFKSRHEHQKLYFYVFFITNVGKKNIFSIAGLKIFTKKEKLKIGF